METTDAERQSEFSLDETPDFDDTECVSTELSTRREILGAAIAGALSLAAKRESLEEGLYAKIDHFRHHATGALVMAANLGEFNGTLVTLRERNRLRKREAKLLIDPVIPGALVHVKVPTRIPNKQQYHNVDLYVANADRMEAFRARLGRKRFNFVQMRGHTGDMSDLVEKSRGYFARHTLIGLGGCVGTQFVPTLYTPQTPVIADRGTGESANNTYLLLRTIDSMPKAASWSDFYNRIVSESSRAASQSVIPGQPDYGEFCRPGTRSGY